MESGRKWIVDFNAGRTQLISFDWSNNIGAINVKMDWSVFCQKSSYHLISSKLSFKLNWGSYFISIAKTTFKKTGALIRSMKFLFSFSLYPYKSTIQRCMEYCCHALVFARSCYVELLDNLSKRIWKTVSPSHATSLEPLAHRQNVASLSLL